MAGAPPPPYQRLPDHDDTRSTTSRRRSVASAATASPAGSYRAPIAAPPPVPPLNLNTAPGSDHLELTHFTSPHGKRLLANRSLITYQTLDPNLITLALCKALNLPEEFFKHIHAAETPSETMKVLELQPGLDFPHHLARALQAAATELLLEPPPITIEPSQSFSYRVIKNYLYPFWERSAGIISFLYGACFGVMVFSITDSLPDNLAGRIALLTLFSFFALFSSLVNQLQASSSLVDLIPRFHKKVSSCLPKTTPPWLQKSVSTLTLGSLFYTCTLPAASLAAETVRRGLLQIAGVPTSEQNSGSIDFFIAEGLMNCVRAFFSTYTIITISDTLKKRTAILSNESTSDARHALADWALPISLAGGGIYGYTTWEKTAAGMSNSIFRNLYPAGEQTDQFLQWAGTIINSIVAAKLLLAGILVLTQEIRSKKYGASIFTSALSCLAGIATGLVTSIGSIFSNAEQASIVVYNFLYASIANVPFLMDASEATKILELKNHEQNLRKVVELIENTNTATTTHAQNDAIILNDLRDILNRIIAARELALRSGGLCKLSWEFLKPFTEIIRGKEKPSATEPHTTQQLRRGATVSKMSNSPDRKRAGPSHDAERAGLLRGDALAFANTATATTAATAAGITL